MGGHAVTPRAVASVRDAGESVSATPNLPPGSSRPPWLTEDYRDLHPAVGGEVYTRFLHLMGLDFVVDCFQTGLTQCRKTHFHQHHLLIVVDADFSGRWVRRLEELCEEDPELRELSISVVASSDEFCMGGVFTPLWVALQRTEWREAMLRQFTTGRFRSRFEEARRARAHELIFRQRPAFGSSNPELRARAASYPVLALPFTGMDDTGIPRQFVGDLKRSQLYVFADADFFQFCAYRFFDAPPLARELPLTPVHRPEEVKFVTVHANTLLPIDFKLAMHADEDGHHALLAMFTLELVGAPSRYYALYIQYPDKHAPPEGGCDRIKLLEVPAPSFGAFLPDPRIYNAPEGVFSPKTFWPVEISEIVARCEMFAKQHAGADWGDTRAWAEWDAMHDGEAKTYFGHFRAASRFPREHLEWEPAIRHRTVDRRGTMRALSRARSAMDPNITFSTTNRASYTPDVHAPDAYERLTLSRIGMTSTAGHGGRSLAASASASSFASLGLTGTAVGAGSAVAPLAGTSVTSPSRMGYRSGSRATVGFR